MNSSERIFQAIQLREMGDTKTDSPDATEFKVTGQAFRVISYAIIHHGTKSAITVLL